MKLYYRVTAVLFSLFILLLAVFFWVLPDKTYSSSEKRNLTQFPQISFESVTDGTFMTEMKSYADDQFPLRSFFMKVKTSVSKALGNKESQGVYACKKDSLMERFDAPDSENEEATIQSIADFASRYPDLPMYMLLSPNAVSVYTEKLPSNALTEDQSLYIDHFASQLSAVTNMTFVDVRPAFLEAKDTTDLFYRTDHHWTTDGAYIAFNTLASAMGLENVPEFTPAVVTNTFYGSLVSESGFSVQRPDYISIYTPQYAEGEDVLYTVTYPDESRKTASLYETSALSGDNAYEIFFGSNHPSLTIDTSVYGGKKLLVIKDSYANSLLPFLIPEYDSITVIDPRYYYDDIDALVTAGGYTEVLFLYNVNTLSEDTVLKTVLNNNQ